VYCVSGAWVALLVAIVFFILGFTWYYGQTQLQRYLHCYSQTTALLQLPHRLGFVDVAMPSAGDVLRRSTSLSTDQHTASSSDDNDDDNNEKNNHKQRQTKPIINILPSTIDLSSSHNECHDDPILLTSNLDHTRFRTSVTGNVIFTVTPGLGVFLTTSSKHTPHVFERVLAHIHAVCCSS
jgi:hypothetical protein